MTLWDIEPGTWEVTRGTRATAADGPVANASTRSVEVGRSSDLPVTFDPRTVTVMELRLVSKGTPYWARPDLGIGKDDIRTSGRTISVIVHSLGAVGAPASRVVVRDAAGLEIAGAGVPALEAPLDLRPRTATVTLKLPPRASWPGGSVSIETARGVKELTLRNNTVRF
jgi:hypothetical protein